MSPFVVMFKNVLAGNSNRLWLDFRSAVLQRFGAIHYGGHREGGETMEIAQGLAEVRFKMMFLVQYQPIPDNIY